MQAVFPTASLRIIILSLAAGILVNGCSSTDDRTQSYIARAMHLVTDSPSQSVDIGTLNFRLPFSTGSGYSSAFAVSGNIETRGFVPGTNISDPFDDTLILSPAENFVFSDKMAYSIINYGTVADFRSVVVESPIQETVDPTTNVMRFVHAALGVGALDVYVTDPDVALSSVSPLFSVSVGQISNLQTIAFGTHQVRITAAGSTTVIYNSGSVTPTLPGRLLYVIGKSLGPTPTPIFLNRWFNQGSSSAIADVNSAAFVRLMHLSADSAALDLIAEDNYQAPLAANIAFREVSAYGEARDTLPDGTSVLENTPVDFIAQALDAEDGDLSSGMTWTSSIDGPLTGSGATITATLTAGEHAVVASVTDAGGLTGSGATTVRVFPATGAAPQVSIRRPPSGFSVASGTPIAFTGSANDVTDGDLSASLSWVSSIDGPLPDMGASVSATLTPGTHSITASAADVDGVIGSDTVTVSVTTAGNTAPVVSITQPDLSAIEFDLTLNSDPDNLLLQSSQQIFNAIAYTYLAAGPSDSISSVVVADSILKIAVYSQMRIVHASQLLGSLDIYFTQAGVGIADASPIFSGLQFANFSSTGSFASGSYDMTLTDTGTTNVVLVIPAIDLVNGQINTVALIEDAGASAPGFQIFID